MRKVKFGGTGLSVSRLSVGTDYRTIYGIPKIGGPLLRKAFELGVNFWDTADDYGAHPGIREALRGLDRSKVVIATKTYGSREKDVKESLERSMREMGTDYIDIFLLHAIDRIQQIEERSEALNALIEAKRRGMVRAIGLSTHTVPVMQAAANFPEIEVILTVINEAGVRIRGGTLGQMMEATRKAYSLGKAIYLMKVLGRGELAGNVESALKFVFGLPYVHSVCVGITSIREMKRNVDIANKATHI